MSLVCVLWRWSVFFVAVKVKYVMYYTLCTGLIQMVSSGTAAWSQSDCIDVLFARQLAPPTNLSESLWSLLHWHKVASSVHCITRFCRQVSLLWLSEFCRLYTQELFCYYFRIFITRSAEVLSRISSWLAFHIVSAWYQVHCCWCLSLLCTKYLMPIAHNVWIILWWLINRNK